MKRNYEYDNGTINFLKESSIEYAQDVYENRDICTIIEDGLPKSWCWEEDSNV